MPVNLSIENVPDDLAARLRERAARSHRSLQGELMVILEEAVAVQEGLSAREILQRVRQLGVETGDESAEMVRAARDGG
jgi:plasmid stability protein